MSEWKQITPENFRLELNKTEMATLTRMSFPPRNWLLSFRNYEVEIPNNTTDMLKWKATLAIGNLCNATISDCMSIRDHLPSLRELADKAGMFDEMD